VDSVYQERSYREKTRGHDLIEQTIIQNESDLQIYSDRPLVDKADEILRSARGVIEAYIAEKPDFEKSLEPISCDVNAHEIIQNMISASKLANVGPMAAIAGAISQTVGESLVGESLDKLQNILIENGGDIYLQSTVERRILIHAGTSPLNEKIAIRIKPEMTPCGICTSSGTVGHSLSFGNADAVVVISKNTFLADATATAIGNEVKNQNDIEKGIAYGKAIEGIDGILIIVADKIGAWGNIEIC